MKKILLLLILLLCIACSSNNKQKEEIKDFVLSSTSTEIISRIDELVNKIQMFPEEKLENEFVYLVEAIKENISKFTTDELKIIEDKLNINYSFSFNSVNFSKENFNQVIDFIKEKMNK